MDEQTKALYNNLIEIGRTVEAEEMLKKYPDKKEILDEPKEEKQKEVKKVGKKSKRRTR